ncbi:MAG TPA: thymidylate kinase [Armatimonadota bacterium]|jgi:dTMP kinase
MSDTKQRPQTSPRSPRFYGTGIPYLEGFDLSGKLIVIEGADSSGRSTQSRMLREWLEGSGHAVLDVGIRRSDLVMDAIAEAKRGHLLGKTTLSLLYATDLADQLENRILPAMRAGFVAVADRYIYTLMARDLVRGASREWLKELFGFALVPDLIFFLDVEPELLLHRAFAKTGQLDYWESGMDLGMGGDMLECFEKYQTSLRKHFRQLCEEYGFQMVDGSPDADTVQSTIRKAVTTHLKKKRQSKAAPAASSVSG